MLNTHSGLTFINERVVVDNASFEYFMLKTSQGELFNFNEFFLTYFPTYYLTFQLYLFSKGWLQNISILESICIAVTVQVLNIKNPIQFAIYSLNLQKKLKSSMLIKLQWVTNLFLQNQVPNQFSQCMEWIELNSQTKELLSSLDHFLFILVSQRFFITKVPKA